jgi:hypothetical protein
MGFHYGKQSATPARFVEYSDLRGPLAKAGVLPKIPSHFGHASLYTDWLMLGNGPDNSVFPGFEGCGDCAWAGPGHAEMEAARTSKRPAANFTGAAIVKQYSEYSGYDPKTGANDNGSNPQDVFEWRQEKGLVDADGTVFKIGEVVSLEPGNLTELWEAAYLFEDCGIGFAVQEAQEDQFARGLPWDYVHGSPIVGGHWVEVMGRPNSTYGALITWGQRQLFTHAFYEQLNDESFAWIDPERYNRVTGETAEHFSDQDLEKYLRLVGEAKTWGS